VARPAPTRPTLTDEQPTDNSFGQMVNPTLSIRAADFQGNDMDIVFRTNASGTWQDIQSYIHVPTGVYYAYPTNMDDNGTTYYWSVNATDIVTGDWTYKVYSFTTYSNPPTHGAPILASGGGPKDNLTCYNQNTVDPDGDEVTNIYNWYVNDNSLTNLLLPFDTQPQPSEEGLFTDGFEYGFDNWDGNGETNWDLTSSQQHSGSWSAHAGSAATYLYSDDIDLSAEEGFTVSFWYRDDDIDDDDYVYLQFWDGSSYNNIFELGNTEPEDTWHHYSVWYRTLFDYGIPDFHIRFRGNEIDSGENLWIDDVVITVGGVGDPVASVKDYSGYGNHGTAQGPAWTSEGVVGGAYIFDGDDRIIVDENGASLGGDGTWSEISVEFWVKATTNTGSERLIWKHASESTSIIGYRVDFRARYLGTSSERVEITWRIYTPSSSYSIVYYIRDEVQDWHHITCTYGSGVGLKIYVDGIERESSSAYVGDIRATGDGPFKIGYYSGSGDFMGVLDEVRIYPRALSPFQVSARYLETKDGLSSNSTIDWHETEIGDEWKCQVTPNDGLGDGESKFSNIKTINEDGNTLPEAHNLTITPLSPVTSDTLTGSYDFFDADGDPEYGTEIRWYKDGVLQPDLDGSLTVSSSLTAKDQMWNFTVRPKDGVEFGESQTVSVTLLNTPPSFTAVHVMPDPAFNSSTLTANPTGWVDDDDDSEGYVYQWQILDGENWQDIVGATSQMLSPGNFSRGDYVRVNCTAFDGEINGTSRLDVAWIVDSDPPTHDDPLLVSSHGTNMTDEELICYSQNTTDPDGDEVTNIYHWIQDGDSLTTLLMPFETNSSTTAWDYSGYGNDGTVYGATWTSDGIVGGAYEFDGDDVIEISDDPSLGGDDDWSEISIEFWVRPSALVRGTRIISRAQPGGTGCYMIGFQTNAPDPYNTLFWGITSTDGGWADISDSPDWDPEADGLVLEVGVWYHVFCTYQSGPGLTIYVNGLERFNMPLTGNIDSSSGQTLFLGYDGGGPSYRYLSGTLDEVRIYPKALTAAQAFQRYIETKDGFTSSSTIVPQETTAGEVWTCEVIPNDSWQDGTAKTSNPLTVLAASGNSRPRIDLYTPTETTPEVYEGTNLNFTHISSDPDGDPLSYSWLIDSVENATSQNWTYSPAFGSAGTHNITLIVSDPGGLSDSQQWNVTVIRQYELTITVSGNGTTTPAPGVHLYDEGANVSVTALPDSGWVLDNWLLNASDVGSANPYNLTMTSNYNLTAVFSEIPSVQYELVIGVVGNGTTTPTPGTHMFAADTEVNLTAFADPGWTFLEWSGNLTGDENPTTIVMDGNKTVTATFIQETYTLTINVVGSGVVDLNATGPYYYGDVVELFANTTGYPGWSFSVWSVDLSGSANPETIVMDGDKVVNATFTQVEYILTVNVIGGGSVSRNNTGPYYYGDVVELTANADPGWAFLEWTGDLGGSTNPESIIMDGNKTVDATFVQEEYTLTVNVFGNGTVTRDPDQLNYTYGTAVNLTAIPDEGWLFSGWSVDLTGSANPETIVMDGDKSVNATFIEESFSDDFNDDSMNPVYWKPLEKNNGTVSEINGRVECLVETAPPSGTAGYTTVRSYNVSDCDIRIEVSNQYLCEAALAITLDGIEDHFWYSTDFYVIEKHLWSNSCLVKKRLDNGTQIFLYEETWTGPTGYLRIRIQDGVIYFYEEDNLRYQEPFELSSYNCYIHFEANTWGDGYFGMDYFDNFEFRTPYVNAPPTIDDYYPLTDPTINEDESQQFNVTYSDPDGDPLTVEWLLNSSLVGSAENYTFTADYESAGTYNVTVIVSDGVNQTSHEWTLTVLNVNRPPTVDSYYPDSNPTISEGESQVFNVTYSDPDGGLLTVQWYLNGSLVGSDDNYTFTADYDSAGVYNVTVVVSDGLAQTSYEWTLTVTNVNRAPTVDSYTPEDLEPEADEGEGLNFTHTSSDLDNDTLSYSWLLDGLEQSTSQNWTYTPGYEDSGFHNVTLVVSDDELIDSQEWNVTVNDVNRSPVIDDYYPPTDPIISEGESQVFNVTYSDPDEDLVTVQWYLNSTPTSTFDNYTFVADYDSAGVYNVTVVVSDGLAEDSYEWTLTVLDVNRPPAIGDYYPDFDPVINEGESQLFNVTYSDPDGDAVSVQWYLNGTPTSTLDNYTFTTDYASAGVYNVTVVVSDSGGLFDSQEWNVTVLEINDPPVIDDHYPSTDPVINEGEFHLFNVTYHDPDSDITTVQWYLNGTPTSTLDNYTFTGDYDSAGVYNVTVVVSDGLAQDSHEWTLTVLNVNRGPTIDSYGPTDLEPAVEEGASLNFTHSSSDPDGDLLSYSWLLDDVEQAVTQNWTYSPGYEDAGFHNVTLVVSDGDLFDSQEWNVTVNEFNNPPTIDSYYPLSDPTITEEGSQLFNVTYSDPDGPSVSVQWYLNGTPTSTLDNYTFTGDFDSAGVYNVTVVISDGLAQASHEWTLTVLDVNRAPTIDSYSPVDLEPEVDEGASLNFTHTSSDPDGDLLSYSWLVDSVEQAVTQNWTYTPGYEDAGTYNVTLIVSDGELTDSQEWNVTVNDVNRSPVMDDYYPPTDPIISEGESQVFNVTYHDPDGDPVAVEWLLNGTAVESNDNYTFTADYESEGTYNVTVVVSDGLNQTSHEWTLTVLNVNRSPTIDDYYPSTDPIINEGESQLFNVTYSDPDGDTLTVQWLLNGTFVGSNDNYTYTADYDSAGVYNVTVVVSDGLAQGSDEWTLTVLNVNRAPTIDSYTPEDLEPEVDEGEGLNFTHTSSDLDNDTLAYSWLLDDVEQATSQNWTYTPSYEDAGTHNVTLVVSDGELTDSQQWNVTVNDVNRSPVIDDYYPPTDPTINEDESQLFNVTYHDPDGDPVSVQWYLNGSLVSTLDNYTFTAGYDSAGVYNVTVIISDGLTETFHDWNLTVNNVNRAPTIDSYTPADPEPTVDEGASLNFTHTSSDPDGDMLLYSWLLDDVEQATSQNWTYTPGYEDAGFHNVTLVVSDGELFDFQQWNVTVNDVNRAPVIDSYYPLTDLAINDGGSQLFNVTYHDPDGDSLTVEWLLDGSFVGSNDNYTFTADPDSSGIYNITVVVSDGQAETSHEWTLTVRNTNLIPLDGWSVDPRYTNEDYVLDSTESSLSLQLNATSVDSRVTIRHLSVPALNLSDYAYVDVECDGTDNALILLRFFLDDGSGFDVVYWKDAATLNSTIFDLGPYAGRTLRGDVYIALKSSDGLTSNIAISEIAFVTEAPPPPSPSIPLDGWSMDPRYTNASYTLVSTESSLFLELEAENTSSRVTIRHLNVQKLILSDYAYVDVECAGTDNALILLRFFLDDGSGFDVVYWKDPTTLNVITFDLSPYAIRMLRGDVYIGLKSSDGSASNITITEISFVDA